MRRNKGSTQSNLNQTINSSHVNNKDLNTTAITNADITIASISDTSTSNLISAQEMKIRGLLKDLQTLVKSCEEVRVGNHEHLKSISKTHEKVKRETKISQFYRKKLHSLYSKGVEDAENEIKSIKKALDCIKDIRTLQSEIHFIKTSSEHTAIHNVNSNINNNNSINNAVALTGAQTNATYSNGINNIIFNKERPKTSMRRGVLMSILQQASLTLPLWIGEIGQSPPHLCGCIPQDDSYVCKTGDKVAARVKNQEGEENWILAEVVSYNENSETYDVDDIDAEDGQERHRLNKMFVVPLPLWRANPITDIEAIFPKDAIVLALYPQTTCFYRGVVSEPPRTPQEEYLILFEDSSYLEGYSPPLHVAQLYVVAYKDIDD